MKQGAAVVCDSVVSSFAINPYDVTECVITSRNQEMYLWDVESDVQRLNVEQFQVMPQNIHNYTDFCNTVLV